MPDETIVQSTAVEENPDPTAWPVLFYGIVGTLVVVLSILLLEAFYRTTSYEEDLGKAAGPAAEKLEKILGEQRAPIEGYGWVDQEGGVVSIPIERAMEIVVEESGGSSGN